MTDATDRRRPLVWEGSSKKDFELVGDHCGDTYRTVYTVRARHTVHVLHAFQKKSKSGIRTPREDVALVRKRFKVLSARNDVAGR